MEVLELKHFCAYLPHKVKCADLINDMPNSFTLDVENISGVFEDSENLNTIRLYLRPLSDLKKDENTNLKLDLCDELGTNNIENLLLVLENENYYAIDIQKYHILEEWMFKNHFDWKFGLIKKGLAIDINTL